MLALAHILSLILYSRPELAAPIPVNVGVKMKKSKP